MPVVGVELVSFPFFFSALSPSVSLMEVPKGSNTDKLCLRSNRLGIKGSVARNH